MERKGKPPVILTWECSRISGGMVTSTDSPVVTPFKQGNLPTLQCYIVGAVGLQVETDISKQCIAPFEFAEFF